MRRGRTPGWIEYMLKGSSPQETSSRAGGKLASDLVELLRQVRDSSMVVVVEASPTLDTEATICDVLLNGS